MVGRHPFWLSVLLVVRNCCDVVRTETGAVVDAVVVGDRGGCLGHWEGPRATSSDRRNVQPWKKRQTRGFWAAATAQIIGSQSNAGRFRAKCRPARTDGSNDDYASATHA